MEKQAITAIEKVNYWTGSPKALGYGREYYTAKVMSYTNNHLLKVLIGQRRCGKSTLLKQTIAKLLAEGVPAKNILYLNFELHDLQFIKDADTLAKVVALYLSTLKPTNTVYLFFDEIQEVDGWEKTINSFLADERIDAEIFLTGSNAHLLSTELSTYVTGRYIEIPIFAFSYSEYLALHKLTNSRQNLIAYIESSGMPELFNLKDDSQKMSYLSALRDSILMNDVVKRFNVKYPKLLNLLLDFIIDNIGHLFSFNSIFKKLKNCGINLSVATISNYISYLEQTLLIHSIPRYDIKGKKILEGERKYYLNDLGFINYLNNTFDNAINRKLENYVFQSLLQAGFKLYIGNLYNLEIDFIAEKGQSIIYIQVTYLLHSPEVIEREYGNLEKIKDHHPKWVVSLDEVSFPTRNGIIHVPAWELQNHVHIP